MYETIFHGLHLPFLSKPCSFPKMSSIALESTPWYTELLAAYPDLVAPAQPKSSAFLDTLLSATNATVLTAPRYYYSHSSRVICTAFDHGPQAAGHIGIAFGGIQGFVLDELVAMLFHARAAEIGSSSSDDGKSNDLKDIDLSRGPFEAITSSLSLTYRKPLPVGPRVLAIAELVYDDDGDDSSSKGNPRQLTARLWLRDGPSGAVWTEGIATGIVIPKTHLSRYREASPSAPLAQSMGQQLATSELVPVNGSSTAPWLPAYLAHHRDLAAEEYPLDRMQKNHFIRRAILDHRTKSTVGVLGYYTSDSTDPHFALVLRIGNGLDGKPGIAHSGAIFAVTDYFIFSIMSVLFRSLEKHQRAWAEKGIDVNQILQQSRSVTATMRLDYHRPIPADATVLFEVSFGGFSHGGRRARMTAVMRAAPDSPPLVTLNALVAFVSPQRLVNARQPASDIVDIAPPRL
ncbi:hypothetical protein GQ42DRAFT_70992 [Ramicandelaber brevisporus]|nr:hypothetical protein GQ42DRAFT_70992 [Ramicandelaber brevisporus]